MSKNRSQRKDSDSAGSLLWFSPSMLLNGAHQYSWGTHPGHDQVQNEGCNTAHLILGIEILQQT